MDKDVNLTTEMVEPDILSLEQIKAKILEKISIALTYKLEVSDIIEAGKMIAMFEANEKVSQPIKAESRKV